MTITPQVIIPMSGVGKRFVDAGYHHIKPLVKVGDSRIINEVMKMFPGVEDPLFIIAKDHKQRNELHSYLSSHWPNCKISEIESHKLGPGHAILESKEFIDLERPSIVSYCDFSGRWNFKGFCTELSKVDSLILTYTGFHPHMLRNTKYAYVQKNNEDVIMIQEKNSFTDTPSLEEASAGLYGFASGNLLLSALTEQVHQNYSHRGEFYISLTIVPLLKRGLKIKTFLMERFFQFGTPEDLKDWEYLHKSINYFETSFRVDDDSKQLAKRAESSIILAGGIGYRLKDLSQTPKPFIKIRNKEIWKYSRDASDLSSNKFLIIRKEFEKYIAEESTETKLELLRNSTQGQADTARYALKTIKNLPGPVTFFSCDNLISQIDYENAINLIQDSDLIVWTATDYPMAIYRPSKYSWIDVNNKGKVAKFSLKTLPDDFNKPSMIIGNFTFKNKELAIKLVDECFVTAERYNTEIYLDSVIQIALELGYEVSALNLDKFFAIGTEEELKTFVYYSNV